MQKDPSQNRDPVASSQKIIMMLPHESNGEVGNTLIDETDCVESVHIGILSATAKRLHYFSDALSFQILSR